MNLEKTEAKIQEIETSKDMEWLKGRLELFNKIIGTLKARDVDGNPFSKYGLKKAELFKELVEERIKELGEEE